MLLAARLEWRRDLSAIIDWRERELARLGVTVVFNRYAQAADVLMTLEDYEEKFGEAKA